MNSKSTLRLVFSVFIMQIKLMIVKLSLKFGLRMPKIISTPGMQKVYVAHPLRGASMEDNIQKVTKICENYVCEGKVIPFSPLHAFSFFDPKNGDQELVMAYCYALLASCDELWLHSGWENSEGCRKEKLFAEQHGIPVKIVA